MEFKGTYTALVSPFKRGRLDVDAFRALLAMQRDAGVSGVVPCGCTGEAATLSGDERRRLLEAALDAVGDTMQVIPGTGTNSTESTVALTQEAENAGAHAAMLITPYYNKPTQDGLLNHYRTVAEQTRIPLILYNVPGRTGVTLAPSTVAALYETGRFAAVKEAGGHVEAVSDLQTHSGITVLSGDDSLTLPMMALGARGVVSVISNLLPRPVNDMVSGALTGDYERARRIHFRLLPVMRAAFLETNPSPIKAMLSIRGIIENEVRLPLTVVRPDTLEELRLTVESSLREEGA
jgi:4-hydroxy-tetrahydrodipicolinate synthase